jgi:acetyl esterase/lipase
MWPAGEVPFAQGTDAVDTPTLTAYLPANPNGIGIVVCPGGGYRNLAMDHEGRQIAEWLNARGIAAFVLKYRLGPKYHHPAMITDAQRALHLVRTGAAQYKLLPDRIGIWGFSAGGHLASTAATHLVDTPERPDFAILAYPVITADPAFRHGGSFQSLLGANPDPTLLQSLSNETRVTPKTPPTFLFHTSEDTAVPPENSIRFYQALIKNKVPAELHLYQKGRHGVGLAPKDPILSTWAERLHDWLVQFGASPRN